MTENEKPDPKDFLANERTYLAWIRTSIGIMAFGFVVGKFALFIKQIDFLLGNANQPPLQQPHPEIQGYAGFFGVILVTLGVFISFSAFLKYKKVIRQIETKKFKPSNFISEILAISVILIGIFLIIYLNNNI